MTMSSFRLKTYFTRGFQHSVSNLTSILAFVLQHLLKIRMIPSPVKHKQTKHNNKFIVISRRYMFPGFRQFQTKQYKTLTLLLWINNNYSMSPSWIWSDKITNDRIARVGYNHFISNKGEWNNCFSKFSNRVLPPIFIKRPERAYNFQSNAPRLPPSPDYYITKRWMKVTATQIACRTGGLAGPARYTKARAKRENEREALSQNHPPVSGGGRA